MAKLTLTDLASAMSSYVAAAKIAGAWSSSTNSFTGLLDKIGKQVTIDGLWNDKLPELDGEDLPLGKTIEEWFMDLTLPATFTATNGKYDETALTTEGAKDVVPALPSMENCFYSRSLGRQKIKITEPFGNFERAMLDETNSGNFAAKIMERLENSYTLTKYAAKKQLIGRFADAVYAVNKAVMPIPTDTATGEAFIEQVKKDVEEASFANNKSLTGANCAIGAAPSLVLFVKKGIIPSLEVSTYAGAINREDLAMPCKIKVVDDFGTQTNTGVYAVLTDERSLRVHNGYNVIRSSENADGDFVNFVRHFELTVFYSKYTYGKVYATA